MGKSKKRFPVVNPPPEGGAMEVRRLHQSSKRKGRSVAVELNPMGEKRGTHNWVEEPGLSARRGQNGKKKQFRPEKAVEGTSVEGILPGHAERQGFKLTSYAESRGAGTIVRGLLWKELRRQGGGRGEQRAASRANRWRLI